MRAPYHCCGRGSVIDEPPAFQIIERSKVYAAAVDQIVESIRAGRFPPGSALPSERVLAGQLGVSRGSLREALRVLEHAGVVEARPGSGTYVTYEGGSTETSMRAQAAMSGEHSPLDLIVARAALEPVCAEQAARSRTESDLALIRRHVEDQQRFSDAGMAVEAADADAQFHLMVAAASHNGVLAHLSRTLIELLREDTWTRLKDRSRATWGAQFLEHHRQILHAIEVGDPRRANQLMLMHITAIETSFLAGLEN